MPFLFYIILLFVLKCSMYNFQKPTDKLEKDVEQIYINYMLYGGNDNPVCSLERSKKIALCLKIFLQTHYQSNGIHLNKVAFFVNSAKCEKKPVHFKEKIFFTEETIWQEMYPCYGRHKIVRTDFITDDNYDKFYVSSGSTDDSIFVYIHDKFGLVSDQYFLYNYEENIDLKKLSDVFIKTLDVVVELKLNSEIAVSNVMEEIELIYMKEKDNTEQEDKISDLSIHKRAAVCNLVLNQRLYQIMYNLLIQKDSFNIFEHKSIKNKVKLYTNRFKNIFAIQRMIPCFSINRKESESNAFESMFLNFIYISEGSRPNSIFVYLRNDLIIEEVEYTLSSLIENIIIDKLDPINTQLRTMQEFNSVTNMFIDKLSELAYLRDQYLNFCLTIHQDVVKRILKVRQHLEFPRDLFSLKKQMNIVNQRFILVEEIIITIFNTKIKEDTNKNYIVQRKTFQLKYTEFIKDVEMIAKEVWRIMQTTKLNNLKKNIKELDALLKEHQLQILKNK